VQVSSIKYGAIARKETTSLKNSASSQFWTRSPPDGYFDIDSFRSRFPSTLKSTCKNISENPHRKELDSSTFATSTVAQTVHQSPDPQNKVFPLVYVQVENPAAAAGHSFVNGEGKATPGSVPIFRFTIQFFSSFFS
jgi:hypothetical protein